MALDIFFIEDVASRLVALRSANARATALARRYGADECIIAVAAAAYQAALDDVATSFGLSQAIIMEVRDERQTDSGTGNIRIPAAIVGHR